MVIAQEASKLIVKKELPKAEIPENVISHLLMSFM